MKLYREIKVDQASGPASRDLSITLTDNVYTEDIVDKMIDAGIYSQSSQNGLILHLTKDEYLIPQVTEDELEEVVTKTFKLKKETEEK